MKIPWVAIGSSFVLAASLAAGYTPPGPTSTARPWVDGHVITVTVPRRGIVIALGGSAIFWAVCGLAVRWAL